MWRLWGFVVLKIDVNCAQMAQRVNHKASHLKTQFIATLSSKLTRKFVETKKSMLYNQTGRWDSKWDQNQSHYAVKQNCS